MVTCDPPVLLDTDVLVSLLVVDRLDILNGLTDIAFSTTEVNLFEMEDNTRNSIEDAAADSWLDVERLDTAELILEFGIECQRADDGEAALLVLARRRRNVLLTNDRHAQRFASRGEPPVHSAAIDDLFVTAIRAGIVDRRSIPWIREQMEAAAVHVPFQDEGVSLEARLREQTVLDMLTSAA